MANRSGCVDLYAAAVVVGTEAALVNRKDPSIIGVQSTANSQKKATWLAGRSANVAVIMGLLAGEMVFSLDGLVLNGITALLPIDVPIPVGQTLTIKALSSSGTAAQGVTVGYDEVTAG